MLKLLFKCMLEKKKKKKMLEMHMLQSVGISQTCLLPKTRSSKVQPKCSLPMRLKFGKKC